MLSLLALSACQEPAGEIKVSNDFETERTTDGWAEANVQYAHDRGCSGTSSVRVAPGSDYGFSFKRTWAELGLARHVRVTANVELPNSQVRVALVISVRRQGDQYFYKSIPLHEVVKRYHQWVKVGHTFRMPSQIKPDDEVRFELWQWDGPRGEVYVDDLVIKKV